MIGDFSQVLVAVRSNIVVQVSREGSDGPHHAFRDLAVLVRAWLRTDVAVVRPNHLVVMKGVIPAP